MSEMINTMSMQIPAKSENESFARAVVAAFCVGLNPTVDEISDIKTAVSEAVTNCVVHAYQKRQSNDDMITIECKLFPSMLEVTISDRGVGIQNIDQAMEPFYTTEPDSERSGMGFTVMQSFMDKISVNNQSGGGTVVTMQKNFTKEKEQASGEWFPMQQDTVIELVLRAKSGDEQAKNTLVQQNQPLIKSLLRRYLGKGVEYDDLYQLGCLGFVKAINKFDPQYQVKFTTYATPLIIGEIKRFLRDDGAMKVSRSVKTLYVKIKKYLMLKSGDPETPTVDEIAAEFGVTKEEVIFAMEASHLPLPLFATTTNDENDESSCLADKIVASDDSAFLDQLMIKNMLARLPVRERQVILLRYYRNATQSEVARRLHLSQVQVSRIEQKVLRSMKAYLTAGADVV